MCFLRTCLGLLSILLYAANTIFWNVTLYICAIPLLLLACVPPWAKKYRRSYFFSSLYPKAWSYCNNLIMGLSQRQIKIQGPSLRDKTGFYILICNHQSWADILLINRALGLGLPPTKYFMKKSLLWSLPIGGLGCWLLGYPFLSRHTPQQIKKNPALKNKDIETTRKTCLELKQSPGVLVLFPEGTRFSLAKHTKQRSPYKNLLKPKATGLGTLLDICKDTASNVIDMRIVYEKSASMWDFMCGKNGSIKIHYQLIPLSSLPLNYAERETRKAFHHWLNQHWENKDKEIEQANT